MIMNPFFVLGHACPTGPLYDVGCTSAVTHWCTQNVDVIFIPIRGKVPRLWLDHDRGMIW